VTVRCTCACLLTVLFFRVYCTNKWRQWWWWWWVLYDRSLDCSKQRSANINSYMFHISIHFFSVCVISWLFAAFYSQLKIWGKRNVRPPGAVSPTGKTIERVEIPLGLHSTHRVDLGWVNVSACNFFVSGPKFDVFCLTQEGLQLIICFSDFWYFNPFRRYSRSKSNVPFMSKGRNTGFRFIRAAFLK